MNALLKFPASVAMVALCFVSADSHARNSATVTRVFNEVSILPPDATRIPASPGAVVEGETAVATGVDSRTELKFPDNTLTRLGANSIFRLDPSRRSVELEQGVVLLQVPKQLGSGRVRTAAVTAAVSGTTLLVEYTPDNAVKIIVIEGDVNLFFNERPSEFTTLKAGDMIIMKPDAPSFPPTVQVDLERLKKTSKLMDESLFGPLGNQDDIDGAIAMQALLQENGELVKTSLMIEGLGTKLQIAQPTRDNALGLPGSDQLPPAPKLAQTPGPTQTPPPLTPQPPFEVPLSASFAVIDERTSISTNPTIQVFDSIPFRFVTGPGVIYDPLTNGPLYSALGAEAEGEKTAALFADQGDWAVFQFNDVEIFGTPVINSSTGPRNLMLISRSRILMENNSESEAPPLNLTLGPELDALALIALDGELRIGFDSRIQGGSQLLLLEAVGVESDVMLQDFQNFSEFAFDDLAYGGVFLDGGRAVFRAGRDVMVLEKSVAAPNLDFDAGRNFAANSTVIGARDAINIQAGNNVDIENTSVIVNSTSEIWALSQATPEEINIIAQTGDVSITDSYLDADNVQIEAMAGNIDINGTFISADTIKAMTYSQNGTIVLNNSTLRAASLIQLYAEGSNGMLHFTGNTDLDAAQVKLAGYIVRIENGVEVTIENPSGLRIFTHSPEYTNSGGEGVGSFVGPDGTPLPTVNQQGFNQRHSN